MISLWQRLVAPRSADATLRRRENLLYVLSLTAMGAAVFWILSSLVAIWAMGSHPRLIGDVVVGAEALLFSGIAYLIARRGAVRVGTYVAILGLVLMQVSSMLLVWQTPMDPSLVFYALAIALGGLLLGRRGALFFYFCSLLTYTAAAYWLYQHGFRQASITRLPSLLIIVLMVALILGILLLVVHYYIRSLESALEEAEELVRVRTAELLREFQQREAILRSVADGVVVADRQRRLLLFNPVSAAILPCLQEESLGRSLVELCASFDRDDPRREVLAYMSALLNAPEDMLTAATLPERRFAVGAQTWVALYAPVVGAANAIQGVVAVLHDITQEVEAINARTHFVSAVAHDLRVPLSSIQGYGHLYMQEYGDGLDEQQQRYLQRILRGAECMAGLVQDLLDLCRLESGLVQMEIAPTSLRTAISEAVDGIRPQVEDQGLLLETALETDLPFVLADPHRLNQVLNNLLSNACHYTPEGGITIRARRLPWSPPDPASSLEQERPCVEIAVEDTGIGIAKEDLERIFERFVRLDHPIIERTGGTGLGLTIVRQLVHLQGGRIWVESRVGEGSTFYFTLPVVSEPDTVTTRSKVSR